MQVRQIVLAEFPFKPCAMVFGGYRPGVFKTDTGFGIRIQTGESHFGRTSNYTWAYFDLDGTGLITKSPRGLARQFTKKVRITDIATFCSEALEEDRGRS